MNKALFKMAGDSMRSNPLRSMLTALGIIIGTGLVVIVLSVGAGVEQLILNEIASIGPETLYVEIQVPSEGTRAEKDQKTSQDVASGVQITTMTLEDVDAVMEHYNIERGHGMLFSQAAIVAGSETKVSTVFAVGEDYAAIEKLEFESGGFFTDRQDRSLQQVVVLGSSIADELFGNKPAVGQRVRLEQQSYEVIGVAEEVGTKFFIDMDEAIYIPVHTALKKYLGQNHILAMSLEMEDPNLIIPTVRDIENILRRRHKIQDPAKDDFVVRTMDQAMDIVGGVTTGISALLFSVAAISLVVGGVGIMNIMYVTVSERTNEIGLKKAIGATPSAIKRQFIYEAILLTGVGALIGVLAGVVVAWLVALVANALGNDWPFVVRIGSLVFALVTSAAIGIGFGYGPAKQAAELDPIVALRKA